MKSYKVSICHFIIKNKMLFSKKAFYFFNLINIAIPNKISKTPTTIRQIFKTFVKVKSKSEVVTVLVSVVEEELPELLPELLVFVLLAELESFELLLEVFDVLLEPESVRFISTAAKT